YAQWITIGGREEGGKKHAGGTPVQIDDQGRILAGPAPLAGKKIDELKRPAKQLRMFGLGAEPVLEKRRPEPRKPPSVRQRELPGFEATGVHTGSRKQPLESQIIPHTVEVLPDGRVKGHALLSVDDLSADPARFQYKSEGIDPKTGIGAELKEVQVYRPEFGGQLLVWRDPRDGKNYVINGHHRYELAKRSGYKGAIPVYFIDAKNEREARAIGALANIAEGRGTALDAARFMRESGLGPEDLAKQGISLKGNIARQAMTLRHLTPHLFNELQFGRLTEGQALAIGTYLWDEPDLQEQLFKEMQKRGRFSVEELEEVAQEMKSLSRTEKQMTLFGEEEQRRSLVWEKAAIKANIKRRIGEQLRAFSTVAQEKKADILAQAGNVIAREENERRKRKLEEAQMLFDIEANRVGEISRILN
ncbi:hypothetical protein, partial [Thermogutta sp.]|uniref:ParB/RepB/Spo0J family partition protein n=1 Tax=Thermogutta sp. TaxID=1962930 RepID=UPI00321FDD3A